MVESTQRRPSSTAVAGGWSIVFNLKSDKDPKTQAGIELIGAAVNIWALMRRTRNEPHVESFWKSLPTVSPDAALVYGTSGLSEEQAVPIIQELAAVIGVACGKNEVAIQVGPIARMVAIVEGAPPGTKPS